MLFFFVPFFWTLAIPTIIVGVLLARALFWLRSLGRPDPDCADRPDQPFLEGEFVEDNEADKPEDGSYPPRNQLEKRP